MEYQEIEVEVRQIGDERPAALPPFFELTRQLVLAGIGAVASARDEAEQTLGRFAARGEAAQRDGERLVRSFFVQGRDRREQRQDQLAHAVERGVDQLLGRLNIPSKRDIDELSARVARLSARVEDLSAREGRPAQGSASPEV